VRMRSRKPCVFARRRLFGWNVRLLTGGSRQGACFRANQSHLIQHRGNWRRGDRTNERYAHLLPPVKRATRPPAAGPGQRSGFASAPTGPALGCG
jgi:hypothetical protein